VGSIDISTTSLLFAFILLIIPVFLIYIYKIGLIGSMFYSVIRMSIQLLLIGIFLKFLFEYNNVVLNLVWLAIMILVAVFSAVKNSNIKIEKILVPTFISFSFATYIIVFYLNFVVIRVDNIFDARYLIVLGGMLLGNSLRGNIIGISSSYNSIKKDSKRFMYILSLGASFHEAILPYLKNSLQLALKPTLASMATMGIVTLPGMMTGVILGGTSPDVAVKYQIMIMIAILSSTTASVVLTILMTLKICFTKYGLLKEDIFSK